MGTAVLSSTIVPTYNACEMSFLHLMLAFPPQPMVPLEVVLSVTAVLQSRHMYGCAWRYAVPLPWSHAALRPSAAFALPPTA